MRPSRIELLGRRVVRQTLFQLPPPIRDIARSCGVQLRWAETSEPAAREVLGWFEGTPCGEILSEHPDDWPRISLFLDNLWEHADGDVVIFRNEVRVTLLHELGHYLGWNEDQIAANGLE